MKLSILRSFNLNLPISSLVKTSVRSKATASSSFLISVPSVGFSEPAFLHLDPGGASAMSRWLPESAASFHKAPAASRRTSG